MLGEIKRRVFNIWQLICVITLSIFDRSVELHLPMGRIIQRGWAVGEADWNKGGGQLFCIASITVPLKQIDFWREMPKGSCSSLNFFQSILEGMPAKAHPYFLKLQFKSESESQTFLLRKRKILRLAIEGNHYFDISGTFWADGSIRIVDGRHRLSALAAVGKTQIRLGIVLEA